MWVQAYFHIIYKKGKNKTIILYLTRTKFVYIPSHNNIIIISNFIRPLFLKTIKEFPMCADIVCLRINVTIFIIQIKLKTENALISNQLIQYAHYQNIRKW